MAPRARPETAIKSGGQLNVRLSEEQAEALDAIAFLYGTSPPDMLRQLVQAELVRRRTDDSLFNQAVRLRREARMALRGELLVLPPSGEVS